MSGFTDEQIQALEADLDRAHVLERDGMSYIEGWRAIAEANRIFGFDAWTRETVFLKQVDEGQSNKGTPYVCYLAKVRVTVQVGDKQIVREGTGYGTGYGSDQHEGAAKEAETDAMKRAMMTFGNPFGLALYDKKQEHVSGEPSRGEQSRQLYQGNGHSLVGQILDLAKDIWGDGPHYGKLDEIIEAKAGRKMKVKDLGDNQQKQLLSLLESRKEEVPS